MTQRVALVTGSSRGIGRAIALRLARDGAAVAVNYRERRDQAEEVVEAIERSSGRAVAVAGDLAKAEDCARLVETARRALGPIDILVNNAGVFRKGDLADFDFAQFHGMREINVDGLVRVTHAVAGEMRARRWGRIVNIASIAGKEGNPNAVAYSASKAGVISLTKSLGKELAQTGVLVNCVTPAAAKTAIFDQMTREHIDYMLSKIPMNRFVTVDEIAALVCWLASEDCSFSTGGVFDISGGRATY
jgi:3-oxoacyl-[acyl-carrier protein] reductase